MSIFYHEEEPPNPSKRCKFLAACITDALANCHTGRPLSASSSPAEEECPTRDFDEEQEVIVSAIRSAAMEKLRHKRNCSFSLVYSSKSGDLFINQKGVQKKEDHEDQGDEEEEFLSVASCFSCCSSAAASRDVFLSVKTSLSRCSSLNGIEFKDFPRQPIIHQFCNCEGWPFGLFRKAVLLPPLPKSPSESWSWRKGTNKYVKIV